MPWQIRECAFCWMKNLDLPWQMVIPRTHRSIVYAKEENDLQRRDAFLVELRQLQQAWPQDSAVREQLAKVLMIPQSDPNLDVS
jgi:hypothetical protein